VFRIGGGNHLLARREYYKYGRLAVALADDVTDPHDRKRRVVFDDHVHALAFFLEDERFG